MASSIPFLLAICCAVAAAHGHRRPLVGDAPPPSPSQAPTTPTPNVFSPHDRICREYLKQFLTGTTDAKDECLGLQNAYAAAACADNDADDERPDPWKRWWHDLMGDDDWTPGGGRFFREDGSGAEDDDGETNTIDDAYESRACCATIRAYYAVRCPAQGTALDPTVLLITSSILVACGLVKALLRSVEHPFVRSFPEAAGCILVGAVAGAVVRWGVPGVAVDRLAFDQDLFLSILLPPILFQAALAIDKAALGRHLVPVATFAVGGTFLSALLAGALAYVATLPLATPLPALEAAIFGALISSIDPVATLSVLSAAGVSESDTTYVLVFGESLLNDGVAIVLFRVLLQHLHGWEEETLAAFIGSIAERFVVVSLGSIIIGLASGVACTVYFWALQGRQVPVVEVGVFFVWALVPYYIGEAVGFSSVISMMALLFFADLFVIGRHAVPPVTAPAVAGEHDGDALPASDAGSPRSLGSGAARHRRHRLFSTSGHLSPMSRRHIGFVAEVVASLMETLIFAYLGLFLFAEQEFQLSLGLIAIVACVGSRAVMVGSLSWLLNTSRAVCTQCRAMCGREIDAICGEVSAALPPPRRRPVLNRYQQQVLFLSGIRGAVSLALVESIPVFNAVAKEGSKFKVELKMMTMSSIIFTVFTFGSATYKFINKEGSSLTTNEDPEVNPERMTEPLLGAELSQHAQVSRDDEDVQ